MGKNEDVMKCIREEQLTRVIQSLVFLGAVLLVTSLSRMIFLGWQNFMYIQVLSYLGIVGVAVFGKYLPHNLKICFLVSIVFILSLTGLSLLGLVGHGIGGFLILCILCTIFFGTRGGIIAVVISAISISVVGLAVVNHYMTLKFNAVEYLNSSASWITAVVGVLILAGLVVTIISKIHNQLIRLVQNLNKQNAELVDANKKLQNSLEEQKRLKAGLEQAQKMELVGVIAGGVVHDLNNVLAASINYPELLLLNTPGNSPLRIPLERIKKSGLKAAAIVDDLLTLSRRRVARSIVLNINNIIAECIASPEIERLKAYHPEVNIEINLDENLWNIEGFPIHLSKTLTNLVSNAAEAMRDRGKVIIETSNVSITEEKRGITTGEYSVLKISDEGEGISDDDKEKIFEPFYTKKEMGRSGTGLGMTVVWNTVKDHNGHISIDSIKGKGTTFTLYFPMTDKPLPVEKKDSHIPFQTGKGESILIVDDVKEQRDIAAQILSVLGYSIVTSESGEEALEKIKNSPTDLVVLDMIMKPGMDGLDTYKKIRKLHPDQKTIIISGFSETNRIKEAQKLGVGTYIKKPYLMETIAHAVREELDKDPSERLIYN